MNSVVYVYVKTNTQFKQLPFNRICWKEIVNILFCWPLFLAKEYDTASCRVITKCLQESNILTHGVTAHHLAKATHSHLILVLGWQLEPDLDAMLLRNFICLINKTTFHFTITPTPFISTENAGFRKIPCMKPTL